MCTRPNAFINKHKTKLTYSHKHHMDVPTTETWTLHRTILSTWLISYRSFLNIPACQSLSKSWLAPVEPRLMPPLVLPGSQPFKQVLFMVLYFAASQRSSRALVCSCWSALKICGSPCSTDNRSIRGERRRGHEGKRERRTFLGRSHHHILTPEENPLRSVI